MQKHMLMLEVVWMVVLGLSVLTGLYSLAEAVITIRRAEVQNGVAVIQGGDAARAAPIFWERALVTQANNGGNFSFQGVVPADCVGSLHEGDPAAAITVALANCAPVSEAPVPQTGQTQCWDAAGVLISCAGTGQDGDIQAGVPFPSPRFTDHGNGTVTDNLTRLIWLKNANCFGAVPWAQALTAANTLAHGTCDLADGSGGGDWRLPNVRELLSLIDYRFYHPALSNAAGAAQSIEGDAFLGVQSSDIYWTSTTVQVSPSRAWFVALILGISFDELKERSHRVWPVRGPE